MSDDTTGAGAMIGPDDASNKSNADPARVPERSAPPPGGALAHSANAPAGKQDFSELLGDIKLPERHDLRGSADPKQFENKAPLIDIDAPMPGPAAAPAAELRAQGATSETPEPDSPVVPVHTLKQDLQHVARDQNMTLVRAVALEADARPREPDAVAPSRESSRMRSYVLAAATLFLLGIAALFGVYYVASTQAQAPTATLAGDSLVFAEQSVALPITNASPASLKQTLAAARQSSNASLGSITRIVPVVGTPTDQRLATLSEFLGAIAAHPPDDLVRALGGTFFLGLHTVDKNAPVFVIPVVSYDRAFAGMLAWERSMNADLEPFFTPVSDYVDQGGIKTPRTFTDQVLRNYDVRVLKDDSGNTILYYSFPTRSILVIAESPYTFAEILTRLQASRRL